MNWSIYCNNWYSCGWHRVMIRVHASLLWAPFRLCQIRAHMVQLPSFNYLRTYEPLFIPWSHSSKLNWPFTTRMKFCVTRLKFWPFATWMKFRKTRLKFCTLMMPSEKMAVHLCRKSNQMPIKCYINALETIFAALYMSLYVSTWRGWCTSHSRQRWHILQRTHTFRQI